MIPPSFMILLYALYLKVDESNIETVRKSGGPYLLNVWSSFCQNSMNFKPTWDAATNALQKIDGLTIGDVECTANPQACDSLVEPGYPKVLFLEPRLNIMQIFNGNRTISNLRQFALEMLEYPFTSRNGGCTSNIATPSDPILRFSFPKDDIKSLRIARDALLFDGHQSTRICREDGPISLVVDRGDQKINYDGSFTTQSLQIFLKQQIIPKFIEASIQGFQQAIQTRAQLVIVHTTKQKKAQLYSLLNKLNLTVHYLILTEEEGKLAQKYFGIAQNPAAVHFIDTASHFCAQRAEGIQIAGLSEWIRQCSSNTANLPLKCFPKTSSYLLFGIIGVCFSVVGLLAVVRVLNSRKKLRRR